MDMKSPFHTSLMHIAFASLSASTFFLPLSAHATNGYFSSGYGAKSQGIAGAGIALPQDALAAATNPAGTAAVGERTDLGLTWFAPSREASITGNGAGADATYSGNATKHFLIPDFGITRQINPELFWGVAVYGNGGMNTDYSTNPYSRFGATGSAGVNLEQLFISPSVAYKLNDEHTVGAALNLAYQRFSAKGLGLFSDFSNAPTNVSDLGTDSSTGAGLRLGWTGKITPQLTLGATWASKISGKFDKYKGLFADGGGFDVPENYGLGLAIELSSKTTLAADVQHIRYSQVHSIGNSVASLFNGSALGSANGPGFGWRDQTVLKLGVQHKVSNDLTLRAGVSTANQVVQPGETFFNIVAPGVVRHHLTFGFTQANSKAGEWSGFYALGLGQSVNGANSIAAGFGGGNANVRLKEHIIGISYAWK